MWMTLLYRGRAHHDEAGPRPQFLDIPRATVAHAGPQPADQLVDEWRQVALVRHPALDPLRHQLDARRFGLPVPIARPGHHGSDGAHAAIGFETASLADDRLPRT